MKGTSTTKNPLGFLTIWIIGWSVGTGALAAGFSTRADAGVLFFLVFGIAQLYVWRLDMQHFVDAAKTKFEVPELSQNMDAMSATWRSKPHIWGLLLWCFLVGVVVLGILLFGTWFPVLGAEGGSAVIPTLLTGTWGYVVWKWLQALRTMLLMNESFSLDSSFERLTIKRKGLLLQRDIELPISGLELTVDETTIHLRSGDEDVAMHCPPSPERERLLDNLDQSIQRAEHDPVTQPEVPEAIAEMIGQKS